MWTGYPPYSLITGGNTAFYVFTVHLLGFASILGAVNFLVTVIYMRAPGMGWNQLNMFVWSTVTAFVIQLVFVPVLAAAVTMLLFDKYLGTHFFDPAAGGDVLLYQNLFWFYSHPAVYVILLPALGILYEVIATFSKNQIFNYKGAVYGGMWGVVLISGEVWVHHLYVSGMPNWISSWHDDKHTAYLIAGGSISYLTIWHSIQRCYNIRATNEICSLMPIFIPGRWLDGYSP